MRRRIFENISLKSNSGTICVEMVKKIEAHGFRIREVPVHHFYRSYGKSQYFTFKRLLKTVIDLSQLWYEFFISRSGRPGEAASATNPAAATRTIHAVKRNNGT
jgi:hypothetical protein